MVIGQYTSNVSEGNRVTFPKRFSIEEGDVWLLTKGLDSNLIMIAKQKSSLLLEDIEVKPFVEAKMRMRQSFVLGNTFEISLDRANRFVIPSLLADYAGINKEVVFAGIDNFIQVWEKSRWEAYQKEAFPIVRTDVETDERIS